MYESSGGSSGRQGADQAAAVQHGMLILEDSPWEKVEVLELSQMYVSF